MTTVETVLIVVALMLIFLIIGNLIFSKLAEVRNPPVGMFIQCDGVRLHYIERGDPAGPCVVLFHGNGSMLQDFMSSGLVDLLAQHNRVVCFDRPGFGYSQRPRFRIWDASAQAALFVKAFNQLGVRDPVVLGHSWGALVAIALSMRKDYPIRGLVLVSGYYFPTFRWDVWLMSGPAVPVLGDLLSYTVAPIISWAILPAAFRKIFAPRSVPQRFKTQFPTSLALRPTQLRAAAEESALLIPTAAQFQASYPNIDCQVRILHGAEDQVIEPKTGPRSPPSTASLGSSFGSNRWAYGHPFRRGGSCHSRQFGRTSCNFDQSGRLKVQARRFAKPALGNDHWLWRLLVDTEPDKAPTDAARKRLVIPSAVQPPEKASRTHV